MYNGATRDGATPGAEFGRFTLYNTISGPQDLGTGFHLAQKPADATGVYYATPVGLGNYTLLLAELDLLDSANPTDIQYVDVLLLYCYALPTGGIVTFDGTLKNRFPDALTADTLPRSFYSGMEITSLNDVRNPAAQLLQSRYRVFRLPNPSDGDPGGGLPSPGIMPSVLDRALGDYILIWYRAIARDPEQNALLRATESIRFAVTSGAFARTP